MPLYRFGGNSLIDEVRLVKNASGGLRAHLHARADAPPQELADAAAALTRKGYMVLPVESNGEPALEIRGFRTPESLLGGLKREQLTGPAAGPPQKIAEDKITFKEWFKAKSLWLVSLIYLGGGVGFIIYESKQASDEPDLHGLDRVMQHVGGYGYLTGSLTSLASLILREDSSEHEIREAAQAIQKAALNSGITLGKDAPLAAIAALKPKRNALIKTVADHPSELMNISFGAAGAGIAYNNRRKYLEDIEKKATEPDWGEWKENRLGKTVHMMDVGLGLGTLTSGMLGTFIKEKAHDPSKPRKKGVAGAWEWLRERPLRIAGYGYVASTFVHLISSIMERWARITDNKKRKSLGMEEKPLGDTFFRLLFVISNFIAELILAFSSKGHGHGVTSDVSVETAIFSLAAQTIIQQQPERREELIQQMSTQLSSPDSIGIPQKTLEDGIRKQVAAFENNPWMQALLPQGDRSTEHKTEQSYAGEAASHSLTQPDKPLGQPPESHTATHSETTHHQSDDPISGESKERQWSNRSSSQRTDLAKDFVNLSVSGKLDRQSQNLPALATKF